MSDKEGGTYYERHLSHYTSIEGDEGKKEGRLDFLGLGISRLVLDTVNHTGEVTYEGSKFGIHFTPDGFHLRSNHSIELSDKARAAVDSLLEDEIKNSFTAARARAGLNQFMSTNMDLSGKRSEPNPEPPFPDNVVRLSDRLPKK